MKTLTKTTSAALILVGLGMAFVPAAQAQDYYAAGAGSNQVQQEAHARDAQFQSYYRTSHTNSVNADLSGNGSGEGSGPFGGNPNGN